MQYALSSDCTRTIIYDTPARLSHFGKRLRTSGTYRHYEKDDIP